MKKLGPIGNKDTENEVLLLEHDVPHTDFCQRVLECLPKLPWIINEEVGCWIIFCTFEMSSSDYCFHSFGSYHNVSVNTFKVFHRISMQCRFFFPLQRKGSKIIIFISLMSGYGHKFAAQMSIWPVPSICQCQSLISALHIKWYCLCHTHCKEVLT